VSNETEAAAFTRDDLAKAHAAVDKWDKMLTLETEALEKCVAEAIAAAREEGAREMQERAAEIAVHVPVQAIGEGAIRIRIANAIRAITTEKEQPCSTLTTI
jgi:hypothetical protein